MCSKFQSDELVWAKMKYCPPWPATVIDPPNGKGNKNLVYVYFYGTDSVGWVNEDDVCSYYMYYKEKFQKTIRKESYIRAVQQIAVIYHKRFQLSSPAFRRWNLAELEEDDQENEQEEYDPAEAVELAENGIEAAVEQVGNGLTASVGHAGNGLAAAVGYAGHLLLVPVDLPQADFEIDFIIAETQRQTQEEDEARPKKNHNRLKGRLFPYECKNKKNKERKLNNASGIEAAKGGSPSSIPSSSGIISVNINGYRKVCPYEAAVQLVRCDESIPSLIRDENGEPKSECPADQPPKLLPEI